MSQPRIFKVVLGVHMGLGHDGIAELLKEQVKIDVKKLNDGDLILCLNRQGDKMKIMGRKGLVLGYLRMPNGQRIMLDALQYIPRTFGGGTFNYDAAAKKALLKRLDQNKPKASPPVA